MFFSYVYTRIAPSSCNLHNADLLRVRKDEITFLLTHLKLGDKQHIYVGSYIAFAQTDINEDMYINQLLARVAILRILMKNAAKQDMSSAVCASSMCKSLAPTPIYM